MASKRSYTKYTPELRKEAFDLWMVGKGIGEIRTILKIGDASGVARIKKEDNWELKRKMLQMQTAVATIEATAAEAGSGTLEDMNVEEGYRKIAERRADIATTARTLADRLEEAIKVGGGAYDPKNLREAWDIWQAAVNLERALTAVSVEEQFILKVFQAIQEEVDDPNVLRRIADKLQILIAQGRTEDNG